MSNSRPFQSMPHAAQNYFAKRGYRFALAATCLASVLFVFSLLALGSLAQEPAGTGTESRSPSSQASAGDESAQPTTSAPRFSLKDLSWLEGEWNGAWGARMAHQLWSAAHAETMVGTLQIVEADKTLVIEMVSLSNTTSGVVYRVLHFTPNLSPWETSGPTLLNLMSIDSKRFVFENQSSGQPRRIIFLRDDADTYTVRSEITPADGDALYNEITFHRRIAQPPRKKIFGPAQQKH